MLPYCSGKIIVSGEDWIIFIFLSTTGSSKVEGKSFQRSQTVKKWFYKEWYNTESYNFYNNNCTFIAPIYSFPWRETYLFTRQIKVQIGKSTIIILSIKGEMPNLAGNKHLSIHFFLHGPRLFHFSTEKNGSDPSEMDIKMVIPTPTQ